MRKFAWISWVFASLVSVALFVGPAPEAAAEGGVLIGRVSQVEGQLLRFVRDNSDWVAVVKDAPFGMDDALYSGERARAEFVMPNNTWVRVGAVTQIQLIALKPDVTEVDVASGVARFYNRSAETVIKASAPYGYVLAQPGSSFDLYVGDASLEVIALKGQVDFFRANGSERYEVIPNSSSIVADLTRVTAGRGDVDADWDDWNESRDRMWAKRFEVKGDSMNYLPAALADDAYVLEENGRWEKVYYNGEDRYMWRPTTVASGWAPFTVGRWTEYYGDNTWIPAEPFGYCTHHHGNWINVGDTWYWAPPPRPPRGMAAAPVPWYPGRVAWIGSGADVGWVPLAPSEPYYARHAWGPGAMVVGAAGAAALVIGSLAYTNHAVVIPRHDFYAVNNYSNVRVTNINRRTIINNYRAAPVVTDAILPNRMQDRNRYNFSDMNVLQKPHQTTITRIEHNEQAAKKAGTVNARILEGNIAHTRLAAPPPPSGALERPKVTSKIVPVSDVKKPVTQIKFQQQDIKANVKPPEKRLPPSAVTPAATGVNKIGEKPSVQPGQPPKSIGTPPTVPRNVNEGSQVGPVQQGTQPPSLPPGKLEKTDPDVKRSLPPSQVPSVKDVTPAGKPSTTTLPADVRKLPPTVQPNVNEGSQVGPMRQGTQPPSLPPGKLEKTGPDVKRSLPPSQVPSVKDVTPAGRPSTTTLPADVRKLPPSESQPKIQPHVIDQSKGVKPPTMTSPPVLQHQPGQEKTPIQKPAGIQTQPPKPAVGTQPAPAVQGVKPSGPPPSNPTNKNQPAPQGDKKNQVPGIQ